MTAQAEQQGTREEAPSSTAKGGVAAASNIGFNSLKKFRDELDAGVSKLSTLSPHQRALISTKAHMTATMLEQFPLYTLASPETRGKTANALDSISRVLGMDTSKIPPKQYEATVRQVWKTARATVDDTLNLPEVKKYLESYAPHSK